MPKKEKIPHQIDTFDTMWDKLYRQDTEYMDYEFPKISVIIPTFNCAEKIRGTLESILDQNYPDFEVIVVDGGSTDRTLEVVKGFRSEQIHIHAIAGFQRYEMLNKGITHSSGAYLNFLFPGDFYLKRSALRTMMQLALSNDSPYMIFCGTLLRDGVREPKILFRHLSLKILRKGQQPTSLQSCWFHHNTFEKIGKFDTQFTMRGGYDLMCRISLHGGLTAVSTSHVLIDYDLRRVNRSMVVAHFRETLYIITKYFGMWHAFKWLFIQKDLLRIFRLWGRSIKQAFFGK